MLVDLQTWRFQPRQTLPMLSAGECHHHTPLGRLGFLDLQKISMIKHDSAIKLVAGQENLYLFSVHLPWLY